MTLLLAAGRVEASQEISGFVKDASGGVLGGATVNVIQVGTQRVRTATTSPTGYYVVSDIPIGEYEVSVELSGFRRFIEKGVVVRVNAKVAVNATLELGGLEDSVTVTADTALVESSTGEIGRLVTGDQATKLQLNGRNFAQLLWLLPGVSSTARSGTDLFGGFGSNMTGQSVNGGRTSAPSWNIDGVDNKDNGGGGNNFVNLNPDAIAEFKVLTTNYSAEYGQNAGPVVNIALKSGTQAFHGGAYEYVRNDALDARAFGALTKQKLRYHNFGWNLGGPLSFGGFNPDKTRLFFFAGMDFKRQDTGTPLTWTVPTQAERNGDFSARPPSQWPVDPLTGQAFPGGIIPPSRFSPDAKRLIDNYPLPNFPGPGGNYQFTQPGVTDVNQYVFKLDYHPARDHHVAMHYVRDDFHSLQNTTNLRTYDRDIPGENASIRWNWTVSPSLINTVQLTASGNTILQHNFQSNRVFIDDTTRTGNGVTYPLIFGASDVIPSLRISGYTNLDVLAQTWNNFNHVFQLKDDLTKVAGHHTLKFGFLALRSRKNQDNQPAVNGTFSFDSLPLALLGRFNNYNEGGTGREGWFRFSQFEVYASDNWKVTPRLTLELGLRYNLLQPQYSPLNNAVVFVPGLFDPARAPQINRANGQVLAGAYDPINGLAVGGDQFSQAARERIPGWDSPLYQGLFRGLPETILPWDGGLGPRFSFAYDLLGDQTTILRGGYGRFFERIQGNYVFSNVNNPPFVLDVTVFGADIENPGGGTTRPLPPNLRSFDIDLKLPAVDNWSLGIQRKLTANAILDVAYVGTHGFNQTRDSDLNQLPVGTLQKNPGVNANALRPYQGYGFISQFVSDATFDYHGLQTLFKVNLSSGGLIQLAYTWSKAITTATNWNTRPVDSYNPRMDRGLADYHRPHVLVASYIYPLPFWQHGDAWYEKVFGGWRISGVTTIQSGRPLNITVNGDPAGIGRSGDQRPDLVGDPHLAPGERTASRWFNPAAFAVPAAGTFGNLGRNAILGPGTHNWDVSLQKLFPVGERTNAELRLDMFNAFNHPSFWAVGTTVGTSSFGQVTQASDPRILQLSVRLQF